jgi:hypothetical protein
VGSGRAALGLEPGQVVERGPYDLLFGERKAPDGTPLGRPPGSGRQAADIYARLLAAEPHATAERKRELRLEATRQARQSPLYFDLTLSVSKSISIFHASLGENARLAREAGDQAGDAYWSGLVAEFDDMIWQAVWAGFDYFLREAGYTRTGSHHARVNGRETGQWHEADLAVAHWLTPIFAGRAVSYGRLAQPREGGCGLRDAHPATYSAVGTVSDRDHRSRLGPCGSQVGSHHRPTSGNMRPG